MKILVTGNMGYVGSVLVRQLRQSYPDAILVGFDMGYFANCLTSSDLFPECRLDVQHFGDVRRLSPETLRDIDAVVHLAALSNDPMGATFENITLEVNHLASVQLAMQAKQAGVKSFVFASSCSVYGLAEGETRTEEAPVNPLTAYAKSKIFTEMDLSNLAEECFNVTCLRFATACGMSDRLRLDLVLNDFVASGIACKQINILSDGTPWRPLIHIKDMARAIEWGIQRNSTEGGQFLAINVGSNEWNFRVIDLAEAVVKVIPNIEISVNKNAPPDKRSYRVSFDKFTKLAPGFLPVVDLTNAINELKEGLEELQFRDVHFRNSRFIRLNLLKDLKDRRHLTDNLEWSHHCRLVDSLG